jgi:hypothetical protein
MLVEALGDEDGWRMGRDGRRRGLITKEYAYLIYRIHMFYQSQVCSCEDISFACASVVEPVLVTVR